MFDSTGAFRRSFFPVEGGYVYYPWRWSSGYLVTEPEYAELVEQWRKTAGTKGLLKLLGVAVVVVMIALFARASLDLPESFDDGISLLLGFALAGFIIWKSRAPARLVRGRPPIVAPRSTADAETDLGRALGGPMAVWMAFVSLCFLGWAVLFATIAPTWGVPIAIGVAVLVFLNLRIAFRAFRPKARRSD